MATTTPNLGLVLSTPGEHPDISVINSNMDKVDAAFGGTPQYIRQHVSGNSTYSLDIENGKAYLISIMTSSSTSQVLMLVTRHTSYIQDTRIINTGAGYYTISISNNQWTITAQFSTWVNVLIY